VVLRTLENKPERRYQHVSDLRTELETICGVFDKLPPNLRTAFGFEYRSKATLFGLPLVHVASGMDLRTGKRHIAKGIIAIGDIARGVVAFGGVATGVVAFGGAAIGVLACGGVGLGLISFSGFAAALFFAFGGFAFAPIAVGGVAFGYYAWGGAVFGAHAVGGNAGDATAREFFRGLPIIRLMIFNVVFTAFGIFVGIFVPTIFKRRSARQQQ
jgi:hypothetical protein